jgi:hypothetical protein
MNSKNDLFPVVHKMNYANDTFRYPKCKQGVCHTCGKTLPFTLKKYLKAKEELWKLKNFTMPKYNLQKLKSSTRNQNPSRYYNSITNLKFQHKSKYHLSKILILK